MKRFLILLSIAFIWTCSSPTKSEPAPQPPTVNNLSITTNEDTPTTFTMTGTDPEGAALTFSISTQPQHGTVTASGAAGTYTPNENFNGTDTFAYIASDGALSSTAGLVSVTVIEVDDDPNTMNVSAVTDEDNAVEVILEAEEYDGDAISFSIKDDPASGTVSLTGDKATYTPNENYYGSDSFTFEAVDTAAKKILNTATASITINPINDAPNVSDIVAEAKINQSVNITLQGSDIDNDNLTYSIVSQPAKGSVSIDGAIATYTASTSAGEDVFTYLATDGMVTSEEGTVTVFVSSGWSKTYGGTNRDEAHSILQTFDGGYLLGGRTDSFGNGSEDMYLVKTDASGNEEWSQTYGGARGDLAYSLLQTSDGGYVLGGLTYRENNPDGTVNPNHDMYLVKTDASGNEEWSQFYEADGITAPKGNAAVYSVIQTSDGGYLLGGSTGSNQPYLVKTDASGNEQWSKTYGGTRNGIIYTVLETFDGGYLLGGYQTIADKDMYLVKTDASGNEEWSQTYKGPVGGANNDIAYSVVQTFDGGYLLGGTGGNDMYLVKTDASGNEEWSQTYDSGFDNLFHVAFSTLQTSDGGYLLGGTYGGDMYLVKTDASGNEEWSQTYGGSDSDEIRSLIQTSNGGYLLGGSTKSFGNGDWDMYLVKIDSQGNKEN